MLLPETDIGSAVCCEPFAAAPSIAANQPSTLSTSQSSKSSLPRTSLSDMQDGKSAPVQAFPPEPSLTQRNASGASKCCRVGVNYHRHSCTDVQVIGRMNFCEPARHTTWRLSPNSYNSGSYIRVQIVIRLPL